VQHGVVDEPAPAYHSMGHPLLDVALLSIAPLLCYFPGRAWLQRRLDEEVSVHLAAWLGALANAFLLLSLVTALVVVGGHHTALGVWTLPVAWVLALPMATVAAGVGAVITYLAHLLVRAYNALRPG
jgi:hypothetical protein